MCTIQTSKQTRNNQQTKQSREILITKTRSYFSAISEIASERRAAPLKLGQSSSGALYAAEYRALLFKMSRTQRRGVHLRLKRSNA